MQVSFDDFQKAFIDGRIDIYQVLEVLVDNFGQKRAIEILEKNIKLAAQTHENAKKR